MNKEKVYYNNIECTVVAQLPNDESVIEFVTGIYEEPAFYQDGHRWQGSVEPIEQRLIVNNKYLSNKILNADDGLAEYNKIIKEANTKAAEIIRHANAQAKQELLEIQKRSKQIKLDIEKLEKASPYYETARKFINREYKYFVRYNKILSLEEFEEHFKNELPNYTNSLNDNLNNLFLNVSKNCISYNNYNRWNLFETLEEAIENILTLYKKFPSNKTYSIEYYKEIVKWDIKFDGVEDYKKICVDNHNNNILKSIESNSQSIERYKEMLVDI